MENKNTSISKPTAESIAEQARNWARSDKNHSAIVLLRNSQTGYTHSAIVCRDDLTLNIFVNGKQHETDKSIFRSWRA